VSIMALLQTDHHNALWLTGRLHSPAAIRIGQRIMHLRELLLAPIRLQLVRWRERSTRRHIRAWRAMVERARQQRALAQLSDRELRDIGITRYEIEFVLRQSAWRWSTSRFS